MRRSWLSREMEDPSFNITQMADVPYPVRFQLAGLKIPEMTPAGIKAASRLLSSPKLASEWQEAVLPELAQRLTSAVTGVKVLPGISGLVVPSPDGLWTRLLLSCGAGSSRFWISLMSPGLESLASAAKQCGLWRQDVICGTKSGFLLFPEVVNKSTRLLVTSFPHFPSGTPMSAEAWWELCTHCEEQGVRLVNYSRSADCKGLGGCLHAVASEFADLSWLEISDPCGMIGRNQGWSLAAVVGSDDFISDLKAADLDGRRMVFAPVAAAVLSAFEEGAEETKSVIVEQQSALEKMCQVLTARGLKLVTTPRTGYFSLWQVPKSLNGEDIGCDAAKFDEAMIRNYSICGRPFGDVIAYSSLDLPDGSRWPTKLSGALKGVKVEY